MTKTMIAALSLVLMAATASAAGLSAKHQAFGLADEPVQAQCLECHGGLAGLAEKTKAVTPNPHANHMGRVQCNACHSWKTAPKLMCNDCHSFPALQKGLEK